MHTSPANQSNNANIKPPNEPAPKQQNFECSEGVFKNVELPVPVELNRYSFKQLATIKNSFVNFFNKVLNVNSEAVAKTEGVQLQHFIDNAKFQRIIFVLSKDGKPHLHQTAFESKNIIDACKEKRDFIIFNARDKKLHLPDSMRGLDFKNASISSANQDDHAALIEFQNNHENYEHIYLSNEEWNGLMTFLEEKLPQAEAKQKESESKEGSNKLNNASQKSYIGPNTQFNTKVKEHDRTSETNKRNTATDDLNREFLKQDIDIEKKRDKEHQKQRLENARIKERVDIEKQNTRTKVDKEDKFNRDMKLEEK